MVVLPSLGRSVRDFDSLAERLVASGFRVVSPEPRGIGQSSGPTDKLTLHDLANDIAAIIKAVGNKPVRLWDMRSVTGWHVWLQRITPVTDWRGGGTSRILVLQGAEDKVATRENGEQLQRQFGDRITVVEIPKAGHALLPEQPDLFANKILEFLRR